MRHIVFVSSLFLATAAAAQPPDAGRQVFAQRCAGCHADGGSASHPLLDPAALRLDRSDIALRLSGCEMPPDNTPLPAADRARLIGWGACAPPDGR